MAAIFISNQSVAKDMLVGLLLSHFRLVYRDVYCPIDSCVYVKPQTDSLNARVTVEWVATLLTTWCCHLVCYHCYGVFYATNATNRLYYICHEICSRFAWWRQMKTFSALLALCARISPVTGEFPSPRPMTRSFAVFFDLRLNKRLSKQSKRRWFETLSRSVWRHCNAWCSLWCL